MEKVNEKLLALDETFIDVLLKSKIDFIRNGSKNHVPGNINLSIRKTSGEMLLHQHFFYRSNQEHIVHFFINKIDGS